MNRVLLDSEEQALREAIIHWRDKCIAEGAEIAKLREENAVLRCKLASLRGAVRQLVNGVPDENEEAP
jgi:hypothetical protein